MHTRLLSPDDQGLAIACDWLSQGDLVAMPTETVYGLAGDARNATAVARIYEAKGRPSFNPLIVHLPDRLAAEKIAHFDESARALAQAFWPGALTMVLPLRENAGIASLVTAGLDTVALRVPAHPAAHALLQRFGGPLAAPSANPSGRISPTTAAHVADPDSGLGGRIPAVLDAGSCPVGVESTIIGWVDGQPALLRPGGIAAEAIEEVLGQSLIRPAINPDAPNAPGQLTSHYAPRASLRLNAETAGPDEVMIGFGKVGGELTLSASGDLTEAAARLFDLLRQADAMGRPIAVAAVPETGLGAAINDRLRRAAAPR
ncbi:L-threonylcarbamoyladenylate synthase [Paracoccus litorisediminis]|uniref:Threonylcarbamoyl-AMP synthase n=1 Tax=Paracoccus litorisediminis TaxID=2006130 RepID=A0A844HFQ2_9RHOB|nr:L-threonylcarbamoyladenylate synthase [Paracoccus litorisediminis]MTH58490.1 threonylcarbamoyl-AMP synthase [Paracoccus litorisediminis]